MIAQIKITKGFTLIELLIVLAIGLILTASTVGLYGNLQVSSQLHDGTNLLVQTLRTAKQNSTARYLNSSYGVKLVSAQVYTLYQGGSYDTRDPVYDRTTELSTSLTLGWNLTGGANEINFSKGLGLPNATGTIDLGHVIGNSRSIIVNDFGLVEEN